MDVRAALFDSFAKEIQQFEAAVRAGKPKDLSPEVKVLGRSQAGAVRFRGIDNLDEAAARGRFALLFARVLALARGHDDAHWGRLAMVSVEPASEQEMLGRKVVRPPTVHLAWGWRDRDRGVVRLDQPGGPHYTLTGVCTAELLRTLLPELLDARALTLVGEASPDALPFVLAQEWPNLDRLEWADDLDARQQDALRDRAPLLERISGATARAARAEANAAWLRERDAAAAAAAPPPPSPPAAPAAPERPSLCGVPLDEMGEEVRLRANFLEIERVPARLPAHVRRLRIGGGGLHSADDLKVLVGLAEDLEWLDIGDNRFTLEVLRGLPENVRVGVQLPPREHADHRYGLALDYDSPYLRDDRKRGDDVRADRERRLDRELRGARAPSLLRSLERRVERLDDQVRALLGLLAPDRLPAWPAPPEGVGVERLRAWAEAVRGFAETAPLAGLAPLQAGLARLGDAPYAFERFAKDGYTPGEALRDVLLVDLGNLIPWTEGAVALSRPGQLAWAMSLKAFARAD